MPNVTETFIADQNWVCPAGVTSVNVQVSTVVEPIASGVEGYLTSLMLDTTGKAWAIGGLGANGQLGTGSLTNISSPVAVAGSNVFKKLVTSTGSGGMGTTFGLTTAGALYAWGNGQYGVSGLGISTGQTSSPVAVLGSHTFISIPSGFYDCFFGIDQTGALWAWGNNWKGGLGVGDTVSRSSPVLVVGGLTFQKVVANGNGNAAGYQTTLGLTTSGALYSWGTSPDGALGQGATFAVSSPVLVLGGHLFTDVVTDGFCSFGITTNGDAYAWGFNEYGRLGIGTNVSVSTPALVLGGHKFKKIVQRAATVYALTTSGVLYAWGDNSSRQLGDGTSVSKSSPVAVLSSDAFAYVASTGITTFGIDTSGNLYSWGNGGFGALGNGNSGGYASVPIQIASGIKFQFVAADTDIDGAPPILAVTTRGALYAWGGNVYGCLGLGDIIARSTPTAVLGSIFAGLIPVTASRSIGVTPGATYRAALTGPFCSFGGVNIAAGPVDQLAITYNQ